MFSYRLSFPRRWPFDRLIVLSEVEGESRIPVKAGLDARLRGHVGKNSPTAQKIKIDFILLA